MKKNDKKSLIIFISAIVLFVLLVVLLFCNKLYIIDNFIYNIVKNIINPTLTSIFKVITEFGDKYIIVGLILVSLLFVNKKRDSFMLGVNLVLAAIMNTVIKHIICRPRPIDINLITETGYSFPSGHSVASMVFYGFIIYLINKSSLKKNAKIACDIGLGIIILLVGLSRIYLGVHYFSDVLAGYMLGIIYLFLSIRYLYPQIKKYINF